MSSIKNHLIQQNPEDDFKSESTIQIEFNESIVQKLATTYDNNMNSPSAFQRYFSRKRSASREIQPLSNEQESMNKKQRNQQVISLSESNDSQHTQRNLQTRKEFIDKNSVSIQNICENHVEWFQDFMQQSLDIIRDTVLQACVTAMSTRSLNPFHS
ncbi:unnamed protein product, partial [Rotaria magnacalcarata]